jgi:tRNA pseudouridine55 synthase
VLLDARPVSFYRIDLLRYEYPDIEVEVQCGKGTYIRSLARDLGAALGCGAYVTVLRRVQVGPFLADAALSLTATADEALARLEPPERALAELPRVTVSARDAERLAHGQRLSCAAASEEPGEVVVCAPDGRVVAIAHCDAATKILRPMKVIGWLGG